MVLRQALVLAGIGVGAGTLVAAATTTLLRSIMFGLPSARGAPRYQGVARAPATLAQALASA